MFIIVNSVILIVIPICVGIFHCVGLPKGISVNFSIHVCRNLETISLQYVYYIVYTIHVIIKKYVTSFSEEEKKQSGAQYFCETIMAATPIKWVATPLGSHVANGVATATLTQHAGKDPWCRWWTCWINMALWNDPKLHPMTGRTWINQEVEHSARDLYYSIQSIECYTHLQLHLNTQGLTI